ncbi:MAG: capsule assembly Wzi family protein [Spirochaetaceae bacterium]
MRFKVLTVLLFLLSVSLFSEAQKVYSLTRYQKLYDALESLQLEAGISQISYSYPYTEKEFEFILSSIPMDSLSSTGIDRYQWVLSQLSLDSNKQGFTPSIGGEVNLETYIQTNKDNDYWIYGYQERKPVVEIDFSAGINQFFWGDLALPLQKGLDFNRYSEGAESNVSLIWNLDQIDAQFPFLALSAIGGDNWSVMFGRDILNYGVGESGSFTISDDGSYHDFLKISTFWKKFKYTMTLVNIDPIDIEGLDPYIEYETVLNTDGEEVKVISDESRNELKIFIDHAFEFRPFDNFAFSLHEVTVRGGGELTFGFLNPLMLMHNLALPDRKFTIFGNSLVVVAATYTPIKNLNIYSEYALDQYETLSEADRSDDPESGDPNAWGILAGTNYLLNLENSSYLFNVEYAYTNPHLYRSSNSWSIYALTRWYHSVYNDSNDIEVEPLGYDFGPDIQLIKASVTTKLFNRLSIGLEFYHILKGESSLTDPAEEGAEAFDKETPSGSTIFKRDIITLSSEYEINDSITSYLQFNALFFENVDNVDGEDITDFQFVIGASYKW